MSPKNYGTWEPGQFEATVPLPEDPSDDRHIEDTEEAIKALRLEKIKRAARKMKRRKP